MNTLLSAIFKSCTTKKSFQISNKYNLHVNLEYESENNLFVDAKLSRRLGTALENKQKSKIHCYI